MAKQSEEHFLGKISTKAILSSPSGKVLICKNDHDPLLWDLPGGAINLGEKPEDALLREIKEELNISPTIGTIFGVDTFVKLKTGKQTFMLIYEAKLADEPKKFVFGDGEIVEAKWITGKDLPNLQLFPEYKRALEKFFNTEEHFVGKVTLRAIIEKDSKIFVCRGIGDKVWQWPGGRMNQGEDPKQALAREIREELGVEINVERPVSAHYVIHTKTGVPQVALVYACTLAGTQTMLIDPAETEEFRWVSKEELRTLPMFEDCRASIEELLT